MKHTLMIVLSLFLGSSLFAQELNQKVMDEKSQKEILIGYCDRTGLMSGDFGMSYTEEHSLYRPDNDVLNALKYKLDDVLFVIVLGTWCGDSKEQVPRFVKLLDCLKYDLSGVTFIGVDRSKTAGSVPTGEYGIEKVPTFIVLRKGSEIGRIIEPPAVSLEKDLLEIISKP